MILMCKQFSPVQIFEVKGLREIEHRYDLTLSDPLSVIIIQVSRVGNVAGWAGGSTIGLMNLAITITHT